MVTAQEYKKIVDKHTPKKSILFNSFKAFIVGGGICVLGQALETLYLFLGLTKDVVSGLTVATLVLFSCFFTGLGIYDNLGQWAGAGSAVPVTGFANAVASAALEHKSEGYVLGVGGNMFKLAGSVIVFGTVSAFLVTLVKIFIEMWMK